MLKVLYICTHNRCRSILAEAITNQNAGGKILAKSAGSASTGEVHPLTLKYLQEADYSIEGLTSTSWEDKDITEGFVPDVVITVCDSANGESCPLWLGGTARLHWGLQDPSQIAESIVTNNMPDNMTETVVADSFNRVITTIEKRVQLLLENIDLPVVKIIEKINQLPEK